MFSYCSWVLIDSYNSQLDFYRYFSDQQKKSTYSLTALFTKFSTNHINIYELLRQSRADNDEERLYESIRNSLDNAEQITIDLSNFKIQYQDTNTDDINIKLDSLIMEMDNYNKISISALKQASVSTSHAYDIMSEASKHYIEISNRSVEVQESIKNITDNHFQQFNQKSKDRLNRFILLIALSISTIFLLSVYFIQRLTKPLFEILKNIQAISSGESEIRCKIESNDEIGLLAKEVNKLADNLNYEKLVGNAKGLFLASMSHEIRTPMNGIIGISELLLTENKPKETREYAEIINGSAHSLMTIINDILDFSKIEAGELSIIQSPLNLYHLTYELIKLYQHQNTNKNVNIKFNYPDSMPKMFIGDGDRIRQIINNLMSNAFKFTDHGEIVLGIKIDTESNNNCTIAISIKDTGTGINESDLRNAFKDFFQADQTHTRHQGTGLGLAISRRLAELMNGNVSATSIVRKGSIFTLHLNLLLGPDTKPSLLKAHTSQTKRNYQKNVLLAEDNIVNQKVATIMLEKLGLSVDIADNGKICLEMLTQHPYDLILMDVHMPEMDGLQAAVEIRKLVGNKSKTPILALSASALSSDQEQCVASGMNGFIAKPLRLKNLIYHFDRFFV